MKRFFAAFAVSMASSSFAFATSIELQPGSSVIIGVDNVSCSPNAAANTVIDKVCLCAYDRPNNSYKLSKRYIYSDGRVNDVGLFAFDTFAQCTQSIPTLPICN